MAGGPARPAPLESITVGGIRVTFLPDGDGVLTPHVLFPAGDEAFWASHPELLDETGRMVGTFGGFLLETGDEKVIVDTGVGDATHDEPGVLTLRGGRFLDSLRRTGVDPADVDVVVYSHFHLDHVGWTARDGSPTIPNARHLAGEGEWDFWRGDVDPLIASVGPPEPVIATRAERLEPVADGDVVAPGVNVMATPGHTPPPSGPTTTSPTRSSDGCCRPKAGTGRC